MLRKVLIGAVLGLSAAAPASASIIYAATATGSLGGTSTGDLGLLSSYTAEVTFTYEAGDSGTLVDEVNASASWHDSQLEVQSNGAVLSNVWDGGTYYYKSPINLGVAQNGVNVATYVYIAATDTISGELNGGPVVSASIVRQDPITQGFGQQMFVFSQADQTNLGTNAAYSDNITSVTILNSAVPEPSTWAMMLAGFAGLGFAGYRRNRSAAVAA